MAKKPTKRRAAPNLKLKKRPQQPRSQATFDAIVDACARLLAQRGYGALTTNHIADAAGVGIASLYEYFPGKDAIVAQVADRVVRRGLARLEVAIPDILRAPPEEASRRWIELIVATLEKEKKLLAVFVNEVPYVNRLATPREVTPLLLALARTMRVRAGSRLAFDHEEATLFVIVNRVASTVLQLVLDPPRDIDRDEIITVLAGRIDQWVAGR